VNPTPGHGSLGVGTPGSPRKTEHRACSSLHEQDEVSWHQLEAEKVVRLPDVELRTGLTAPEVERRQERFGPNRLTAQKRPSEWVRFLLPLPAPLAWDAWVRITAIGGMACGAVEVEKGIRVKLRRQDPARKGIQCKRTT